jgi:hypothetical protein
MKNIHKINQHTYITSDEEIKRMDWVYCNDDNMVIQLETNLSVMLANNQKEKYGFKTFYKIILTTDQDLIKDGVQAIDDEFLEWFVKNPSCEEIDYWKYMSGEYSTMTKEEPKQETLEEFAERLCPNKQVEYDMILEGAKWQQEQYKKLYSEEIVDILDNVRYWETCPNSYKVIIERFIEEFKKK